MSEPALDYVKQRTRVELHDGRIVAMSPGHSTNHGAVSFNISSIFRRYLKGKPCRIVPDGIYLRLSEKDRFLPDVMIVCDKEKYKTDAVYGAPDLVVEVLSPSTKNYDRGYKKSVYEKFGVKEYWLVNTDSRSVEVHLLRDGRLEFDNEYAVYPDYYLESDLLLTDEEKERIVKEFSPSIFPEMVISIEEIFEGMI
ncbi:MAG: Uma2 family endonuclease [Defluviitaleaceae bacterium]|nr:Uma2 family endonuclease [Defluviitaleaceae bacterium]MCL2836301.1 Uma2 family endonuclease [Defluviitaleaceae bacterium]